MKRFFIVISAFSLMLVSCNKDRNESDQYLDAGQEIGFGISGGDMDFDVSTKASEVTSLSNVYWECKNSSSSVVYAVASYPVSSGKVSTGKYWPSTATTYNYMVSNVAFTSSTGTISAAANTTDIVVGTATGVTNNTCSVTLNHIFARTATLTFNTQSGYTLSNVTWKIQSKGAGTGTSGSYTIGSGWASSGSTALSQQTITSSSDLYLIPGTYTVTVSYTLTKGAYVKSFTKSGDVTLEQGKKNSITGTASGGDASEVSFSVTVSPWQTCTATIQNFK